MNEFERAIIYSWAIVGVPPLLILILYGNIPISRETVFLYHGVMLGSVLYLAMLSLTGTKVFK